MQGQPPPPPPPLKPPPRKEGKDKNNGKGGGKTKHGTQPGKRKEPGTGTATEVQASDLVKEHGGRTFCIRFNKGNCRNAQCKYLHACAFKLPSGEPCGLPGQATRSSSKSSRLQALTPHSTAVSQRRLRCLAAKVAIPTKQSRHRRRQCFQHRSWPRHCSRKRKALKEAVRPRKCFRQSTPKKVTTPAMTPSFKQRQSGSSCKCHRLSSRSPLETWTQCTASKHRRRPAMALLI